MWKVTLKGLLAHKLRLALTALAIVLGVTFISGSLVLTDTLHDTFTSLVGNAYQHIDFEVRGQAALSNGDNAVRNPIPESLLAKVRHVPGVAYADGSITGYAQYVSDGNAISNASSSAGISFDPNRALSAFQLSEGKAPTSSHDVAMDLGTADKYHFKIGDHVRILLPNAPEIFTITGLLKFGTADNLAGTTIAAFDLPTAQKLFSLGGKVNTINVLTTPGADKATVQHDIARILPAGVEVVTGQTVINEDTSDINEALSVFSTALVIFALISLFVGGFTIFNTFSITVGQRTRELALLRIVGASRRQVFRSVLTEAAIVGLVASLIGLGLGVLAAKGLVALLSGFGVSLPTASLVFGLRTVIVGLAVGIGVTVVSCHQSGSASREDSTSGGYHGSTRRIRSLLGPARRYRRRLCCCRRRGTRHRAGGIYCCAGRSGRSGDIHRCRHARTDCGATHGQRDRPAGGAPVRSLGTVGPGELHAQPAPDRSDRSSPHGRVGIGLGHVGLWCVTVQVDHQQHRQRGERRSRRHGSEFGVPELGGQSCLRRARSDRVSDGLSRSVRVQGVAGQRGRGRRPTISLTQ